MTIRMSTISPRGRDLANQSLRKKFAAILGNLYDPDTNPDGIVNIGTAENYAMIPEVVEFVNSNYKIDAPHLNYGEGPWGSVRLRKAMANHMHLNFPTLKPLNHNDILFANGVTSLCEMLGWSIFEPGDAIMLTRPIYQAFQGDFGLKAQVKPVFVPFGDVDQFTPEAIAKYEAALLEERNSGTPVRAMMLCNPHNPLGRCYPKQTLIALMQFCQKHRIHLLCDEIYALSVYDVPDDPHALKFTSVLSFDTSPYISTDFLHVLYGVSKDEGAGGLRLGCFYTQNVELMDAMGAITQFHWSGGPSQLTATIMLEDQAWMAKFAQLSREKLAARNKLTRHILEENGVEYYPGANAGFFLWVNLGPFLPGARDGVAAKENWEGEGMLMKRFMENRVFLTSGGELKSEEAGWFRVVFSQQERVLREGLKRFVQTLQEMKASSLPPLEELKLEAS